MKQAKLLLFCVVIFAMLFAACADSITQGSGSSQSSDPAVSETETNVEPDAEPEEILVSVDFLTDELLSNYESYYEFVEFEDEGYQKIIFTSNVPAKDFRFIEVDYKETDEGLAYYGSKVLYAVGQLSPTKPFVVTWMEWGSIPHRGISFRDETDTARYFYIAMNGEDGSLYLAEFENE